MNARKVAACFTGVLSLIMLAEAWLLAAGVVPISPLLKNARGGDELPDCNRRDESTVKCVQHPELTDTCGEQTYIDYVYVTGQWKDLLVDEDKKNDDVQCNLPEHKGCKNAATRKYLGDAPKTCKKKAPEDPGGGGS